MAIHRKNIVLASNSAIRGQLLRNAKIEFTQLGARIDEEAIKCALIAEGAVPGDIADHLAEVKAIKLSAKDPDAVVLGCDQVLALGTTVFSKPKTVDEAVEQLRTLSGQIHRLYSAVVLAEEGRATWRFVGTVDMHMRKLSEAYIQTYADRNWPEISHSVGAYKIEGEGSRLFVRVQGDYFTVLGLPLLETLNHLMARGMIDG